MGLWSFVIINWLCCPSLLKVSLINGTNFNTAFLLADHIANYQAMYSASNIDCTDVKKSSVCSA
jgi:hypothetical protein